jgi:hypothetical protein
VTRATPSTEPPPGSWVLETTLPEFEGEDVVVASDRVIAVGCRVPDGTPGCVGAAIRVFVDGVWTAVSLTGDAGSVELKAVAAGAAGFVAVGHVRSSGDGVIVGTAVFVSSDGGSWSRAPDQPSLRGRAMVDVVARGNEWIAVGSQTGPSVFLGFETWSSPDGVTWTLVDSMPDTGPVGGVTAYTGGLIAWGSDCLDVCGPPERAAIWTSDDGASWRRVAPQPSLAGGHVNAVLPLASGALAIGSTYDAEGEGLGTAWRSADGAAWSRTALPDASRYQGFEITTAGDELVAVGERHDGDPTPWGTWRASDPSTWVRLSGGDLDTRNLELAAAATEVIAIGRAPSPADSHSSVWRMRLE